MYVCQTITFESLDIRSLYLDIRSISEECGQVRMRRSSGQGHGHTSRKTSAVRFNERMNTAAAQTAWALRHPGAACKHDDGKKASYLISCLALIVCTHSRVAGLRLEGSLLFSTNLYVISRRFQVDWSNFRFRHLKKLEPSLYRWYKCVSI